MNWQPIETAPLDGKPILCGFRGQFLWVYFVCDAYGKETRHSHYAVPTHWQPLPEPPETA